MFIQKASPQGEAFFVVCYVQESAFGLFAAVADRYSAGAEEERRKQDQAARIYVETEISEFSAAAAQEQDDQKYPGAVAAAESHSASAAASAVAVSVAFVVAVIKHTVEHFYLHSSIGSTFVFD